MERISEKKRIVVKVGTSTLTHRTGRLNIRQVEHLVKTLADIYNAGHEVILVSSGSIGLGMGKLGLLEPPKKTADRQACSAVGQCELMNLYGDLFSDYSITVAQVLLTKYELNDDRRKNVENTLERLLSMGVIPVVNENDTVAIDEVDLEVGENDTIAAIVATIAKADLLIMLSDIEGLYDKDPNSFADATVIPVVHELSDTIWAAAGESGSPFGSGGMKTKLHAVEIAYESDIDVVLLNGSHPQRLYDLFADKTVGTLFSKNQ